MEKDLLKILVVDDTAIYRQILSKVTMGFEKIELLGVAPNGKIALSKIDLNPPDLVLLDVFMPEMDGLETLKLIKKNYPHIDVIMLSGMDQKNAKLTMEALESGALDFIAKPQGAPQEENVAELRSMLSRLILMARTRKYSRQARGIFESKPAPLKSISKKKAIPWNKTETKLGPENHPKIERIDVVALGVSTGGPNVLQEIIPEIEKDFQVPLLVVQHMPAMFTASLAERLDKLSAIRVLEAKEGQRVKNGVMYIAPGGYHMVVKKNNMNDKVIALLDSPPVNSCRPSVDVLFRSIAMIYGGNVLAVILTGMGNDGVSGVSAIRRRGGYSIVQDEKTSVIWGMPGAVVEAKQANEVIAKDRIASRIMGIVKGRQQHV